MNCVFCQTPLQGLGARYCVACYKQHARECPHCTDLGKIKKRYKPHNDDGKGRYGDETVCSACGVKHLQKRFDVCPKCNNSRVVIEEGATK